MGRRYFKWTPEALDRLRQNPHINLADMAAMLGCSYYAAACKRAALQRAERGGAPVVAPRRHDLHSTDEIKRVSRMLRLSARIGQLKNWKAKAA